MLLDHVLTPALTHTLTTVFEGGEAWLAQLPALLDEIAQRWDLTLHQPAWSLSFNVVLPATLADGTPVVLKLGVPNRELTSEAAALLHFAGRGAARLLHADPERGVLLLERVWPGTPLVDLGDNLADDDQRTRIAAQVMQKLWHPPPPHHPFPTIHAWAKGMDRLRQTFNGGPGPFPTRLVEMAEAHFRDLLADPAPPVLLHGDLHHWNILAGPGESWLAIDPKGVVGEPAYEVGALLRNPFPNPAALPDLPKIQARRIAILSEILGMDAHRLRTWAFAQAILSAWWSYEDRGTFEPSWLAYAGSLIS